MIVAQRVTTSIQVPTDRRFGNKALILAWTIEGIAISMGLLLAVYAGIEGSDGGFFAVAIAVMPFVALSAIELTKIPLVGLAFAVPSLPWKLLAVAALTVVTLATFENFVFGFERGFAERLRNVAAAEDEANSRQQALERAQVLLPRLRVSENLLLSQLASLREERAGSRAEADADIADARQQSSTTEALRQDRLRLEQEMTALEQRRTGEIERERRRCANNPETRCGVTAIDTGFRRQREEFMLRRDAMAQSEAKARAAIEATVDNARSQRTRNIEAKDRAGEALQRQFDTVREEIATAGTAVSSGADQAAQSARRRDELIEKSQLHRLSKTIFGSHDGEDLERTKRFFVISLSAIVALIGTVIAAMHYAAQASRPPQRRRLGNAIRGYLARLRRQLPARRSILQEVPRRRGGLTRAIRGTLARRRRALAITPVVTEVEVIKEVEVPIDRLKIVFLPIDASEEEVAQARQMAQQDAA